MTDRDADGRAGDAGPGADAAGGRSADAPPVPAAVAAGAALFNEGYPLAAHEPWEAAWLPLDEGDDERLLHGLIAAAAATHHATDGNWSGATGCAENAARYLGGLDGPVGGVDAATVAAWCRRLATDPETIERTGPPPVRVDGSVPRFDDLDLPAALLAAPALAAALDRDEATFETAASLAREERGTGRTRFAALIFAFLREPDARPQVAARLADHVELAERKRRDVDDLF
jgi:hypothetical protein